MSSQPALVFTDGELKGRAVRLEGKQISIGRSRSNDLTLVDDALSRQHLIVRPMGADILVEDLDSAHGTFLNGKRLRGILSLTTGDEVQLGGQKFTLMSEDDVEASPDLTWMDLRPAPPELPTEAEPEEPAEAAPDAETRYYGSEEEAEDLEATRYQDVGGYAVADEDEDAKTRVLEDSATRMLDVDELSGLKPGKKAEGLSKQAIAGILLVALLLIGGGVAAMVLMGGPEETEPTIVKYQDRQYFFAIGYPSTWLKTSTDPDAIIVFEHRPADQRLAYLKAFVDASLDHEVTGLTIGFRDYVENVMSARHDGFRLKGSKQLELNGLRVIQYGFSSNEVDGFGLFTYAGPNRYDIEVAVVSSLYQQMKRDLLYYLQWFALRDPQQYIDFPLPDETIRRQALADPPGLAQEAERDLRLARDRMERLGVRSDNLYRAIEQYQLALTKLSALSDRPDFYNEAARELGEATQLLSQKVEDQWFKVRQAEKTGNWEAVEWELTKILALVPDKNDPIYRKAEERLRRYGYST